MSWHVPRRQELKLNVPQCRFNEHIEHSITPHHRHAGYRRRSRPCLCLLGRPTRASGSTSTHPKFAVAEEGLYKHLLDGSHPVRCYPNHGVALQSLVSKMSIAVDGLTSLTSIASFQQVQHLSALQSSIRFLPSLIVGAILNLSTGLLVHKISAYHILLWAAILTAGSPLIMALIHSGGTYWEGAFFAQVSLPRASTDAYRRLLTSNSSSSR